MIYLHYKSPTNVYQPNPDDIYLYFDSYGQPSCGIGSDCTTCPLAEPKLIFNCAPAVTALLTTYPDPTVLTPDTHPEIFL